MEILQLIPTGYSTMRVFFDFKFKPEKMIEDNSKWLTGHEIVFMDSLYGTLGLDIIKIIFKTKADFYIEIVKRDDIINTNIYHRPSQINEVIFYIKQLNKLNLNYGD